MLHVAGDVAVGEHQHTVREGGRTRIVGDHDDRLAVVAYRITQEAKHFTAGARVEVAGRLVGEDHGRTCHDGAGAGHTLLLAAGQLAWTVGKTLFETDHLDHLVEPFAVDRTFRDLQRQQDVFFGGQRRHQIERLEDEANLLAAQVRQLLLVHGGDLESLHDHLAGRRGVEPGHAMHERGLAGTGRAHDGGHFTALEFHIHMIQRHHFVVF